MCYNMGKKKEGCIMNPYYQKDGITIYNNDNLEVLRNLPSNSISLIYCDILYNTGKKFDDYEDILGEPKEAMEWYRPRFLEMKRTLTENGSIFIHCNWRLDSYMRILLDEIFGTDCFRNRIYRKHSDKRGFYSNFDSQVDIILYYVKSSDSFIFHELKNDQLKVIPLYENGYVPERSYTYQLDDTLIDPASQNKHWLITESQLKKLADKGEVVEIDNLPYRQTYTIPVGNLWAEDNMLDPYSRSIVAESYDTPKPDAVLERIIDMCSNDGDTVADFFLGGGTTAVVTKKRNRKGIFCDISKKACDITIQKLENLDK